MERTMMFIRKLSSSTLSEVGFLSSLVVVNFPHFHFLLKNHLVDFNLIWHKGSLYFDQVKDQAPLQRVMKNKELKLGNIF